MRGYGASQVNYVTKSGSNQFHGNLYELWNGSRLNAADFFTNAMPGNHKPRSTVNHFGGSVGGRIVRDKLFFFFDSEWARIALPIVTATTVPTPAFQNYVLQQLPLVGTDSITGSSYAPAPQLTPFYQNMFSLYRNANGTPLPVLGCPFGSDGAPALVAAYASAIEIAREKDGERHFRQIMQGYKHDLLARTRQGAPWTRVARSGWACSSQNSENRMDTTKLCTRELSANLDHNRRIDWFFDDWVYGTDVPSYKLESKVRRDDAGRTVVQGRIEQSGVPDGFEMLVPVVAVMGKGRKLKLGTVAVSKGGATFRFTATSEPGRVAIEEDAVLAVLR